MLCMAADPADAGPAPDATQATAAASAASAARQVTAEPAGWDSPADMHRAERPARRVVMGSTDTRKAEGL